jgi:MOSC domain-containing protein YiiM
MGEVADRTVHGGPDKAVHAHDAEDYRWWEDQLGTAFEPGTFGDNLTTSGLRLNDALVGERWRVGSALLEVAQPRNPEDAGELLALPQLPSSWRDWADQLLARSRMEA